MQAWKTVFKVFLASNRTRNRCCLLGLKELYFTPFTQHAAYSCTTALFNPRDKSDERFTSSKLRKTFVSKQHKYAANRDDNFKPAKTQRGKVSSELQKLRFEDFSESETGRVFRHNLKESESTEGKELEIVFGAAPCLLALTQSRRKQSRLFVKNGEGPQREVILRVCQEAVRRGVQIQRVSKQTLDKMCGGKVHQGLCLQASPLGFITEERPMTSHEVKNLRPLWLVLDGVQDPMNLGAILRSAYFLGVDRIASSIHNSCPLTPTVSKASAGVMEVMEVFGYSNLKDMIKVKAEEGWQVVGTVGLEQCSSESSVVPCSDFKMSRPTLLLMGGEGDGLSPEMHQMCDVLLTIPPHRNLHPGVDSLNVSVATGILLHSLLSTRTGS
ncbi:rRNA methyltransferase 1, mitochondrial [Carassius carassius]|uniref:rRNA methyltransferase 1, mitochondrial n=1 Tax=Carassius carassius TaxID=217509 RepID=UPI0028686771|nr:rRNA methyltransferase 1, mitochondrial [Carassius carassius]XP_059402550.1 rRNA methyltransferase 1, mitochondrial [Carassius carassius]